MFGMSIVLFCDGIALYAFTRTMHIMHIMTSNGHNIENSICFKNVIPVLWKEFLSFWNYSGIKSSKGTERSE